MKNSLFRPSRYQALNKTDRYFADIEAKRGGLHLPQEYVRIPMAIRDAMQSEGIDSVYVEAPSILPDTALLHRSEIVRHTYET